MSPHRPALVAHRAFAHPLWVGSLLLLLVNDHLLKGAGLLPGWATGKLSDFAGLFMAPALLAALLGVRGRGGFAGAHLAVGVGFAALKLWPPAARGFEALLALGLVPAHVVVDPTDLIALPSLWASLRLLTPLAEGGAPLGAPARASATLLASFACVATSAPSQPLPPGYTTDPRSASASFPPVQGSLGLANDTGQKQVLRVRPLRPTIDFDCTTVAASPSTFFHPGLFAPAETWLVDDGRILPLTAATQGKGWVAQCQALLIEGDNLAPSLVFWSRSQFAERSLASHLGAADPATTIKLLSTGGRLALAAHPAAFPGPSLGEGEIAEECRMPSADSSVDWSEPLPYTAQKLQALTASPDGCLALDMTSRRVFLCGLQGDPPFAVGDELRFTLTESKLSRTLAVSRGGSVVALLGRGTYGDSLSSVHPALPEARPAPVAGCLGQAIECGGLARPAQLDLTESALRPGDSAPLLPGRLDLLQARYLPIFDADCTPGTDPTDAYLEWTAVLAGP